MAPGIDVRKNDRFPTPPGNPLLTSAKESEDVPTENADQRIDQDRAMASDPNGFNHPSQHRLLDPVRARVLHLEVEMTSQRSGSFAR